MVSIPYRKVRNTAGKLDIERLQVSIPYRKVRNTKVPLLRVTSITVSIPYRKVRNKEILSKMKQLLGFNPL